jgi:hypothetical protein
MCTYVMRNCGRSFGSGPPPASATTGNHSQAIAATTDNPARNTALGRRGSRHDGAAAGGGGRGRGGQPLGVKLIILGLGVAVTAVLLWGMLGTSAQLRGATVAIGKLLGVTRGGVGSGWSRSGTGGGARPLLGSSGAASRVIDLSREGRRAVVRRGTRDESA